MLLILSFSHITRINLLSRSSSSFLHACVHFNGKTVQGNSFIGHSHQVKSHRCSSNAVLFLCKESEVQYKQRRIQQPQRGHNLQNSVPAFSAAEYRYDYRAGQKRSQQVRAALAPVTPQ